MSKAVLIVKRADEPRPDEPVRPGASRVTVLLRLREIGCDVARNPESAHSEADDLLLELIDDAEIRQAYRACVPRWYGT